MALDPLTFLVLGSGRMGHRHAQALASIRSAPDEVLGQAAPVRFGIYARNPDKLRALSERTEADFASDQLEASIARADVDVVDNCLVNRLHFSPLMRAVREGKHVFTDKPLGMTLDESRQLTEAVLAAGAHHGIVQNMRFQAGPAAAKAVLDSGELGQVFHARVVFGYFVPPRVENRPPWFFRKDEAGGGVVHDMMAHFYDLLGWLIGPITRTHCVTFQAFPQREDPELGAFASELEDSCAVTMRFQNGAIGQAFSSWVRRKHEDVPTFEIDCAGGGLLVTANRCWVQRGDGPLFQYDPAAEQEDPLSGWEELPTVRVDPFEAQLRAFIRSIHTGQPYSPDWNEALRTHQLIEAAYRSAETGREEPPVGE